MKTRGETLKNLKWALPFDKLIPFKEVLVIVLLITKEIRTKIGGNLIIIMRMIMMKYALLLRMILCRNIRIMYRKK